jgi:hypothetical protein
MVWLTLFAVLVASLVIAIKVFRVGSTMNAGDLMRVEIPREGPLAMGTRLDVAAALKKAGEDPAELQALIRAEDDEELLRRYWTWKYEEEP